jgi:hypothetical protein
MLSQQVLCVAANALNTRATTTPSPDMTALTMTSSMATFASSWLYDND